MLFTLTSLVDFLGMAVSVWLATYLLGKGFSSRITLRVVIVLYSLGFFFLGAYLNLYNQIPGTAAARAVLLLVGLSTWHDLSHKLLPPIVQRKMRWQVGGIYLISLISIVLLLGTVNAFVGEVGNILYVGRMGFGLPYIVYGITQILCCLAFLYNFLLGARMGVGSQNRFFLAASLLASSTVAYGVLALALTPPLPRVIQDSLVLSSVAVLGYSVARHQTLVERRATMQEFPVSGLAVLSLSIIYTLIAYTAGASPITVILVTILAILTHALYNVVREVLDRLRSKDEYNLRRQFRILEKDAQRNTTLQERLQGGITLLCQVLDCRDGFIAIKQEDQYRVSASHHSLPTGTFISIPDIPSDETSSPPNEIATDVIKLAPAYMEGEQVAVIGIGEPKSRLVFLQDDLDLLVESADRVGSMISHFLLESIHKERLLSVIQDTESYELRHHTHADDLIETLVTNPDPGFIKQIENGLRNLSDVITLGQSSLPKLLGIAGATHVERGKAVREQIIHAIEMLKPGSERPKQPLPREWYSYVILHDAYIDNVPNNEIMSQLYISEGTFNRNRQKALRGIARLLLEKKGNFSGRFTF